MDKKLNQHHGQHPIDQKFQELHSTDVSADFDQDWNAFHSNYGPIKPSIWSTLNVKKAALLSSVVVGVIAIFFILSIENSKSVLENKPELSQPFQQSIQTDHIKQSVPEIPNHNREYSQNNSTNSLVSNGLINHQKKVEQPLISRSQSLIVDSLKPSPIQQYSSLIENSAFSFSNPELLLQTLNYDSIQCRAVSPFIGAELQYQINEIDLLGRNQALQSFSVSVFAGLSTAIAVNHTSKFSISPSVGLQVVNAAQSDISWTDITTVLTDSLWIQFSGYDIRITDSSAYNRQNGNIEYGSTDYEVVELYDTTVVQFQDTISKKIQAINIQHQAINLQFNLPLRYHNKLGSSKYSWHLGLLNRFHYSLQQETTYIKEGNQLLTRQQQEFNYKAYGILGIDVQLENQIIQFSTLFNNRAFATQLVFQF